MKAPFQKKKKTARSEVLSRVACVCGAIRVKCSFAARGVDCTVTVLLVSAIRATAPSVLRGERLCTLRAPNSDHLECRLRGGLSPLRFSWFASSHCGCKAGRQVILLQHHSPEGSQKAAKQAGPNTSLWDDHGTSCLSIAHGVKLDARDSTSNAPTGPSAKSRTSDAGTLQNSEKLRRSPFSDPLATHSVATP